MRIINKMKKTMLVLAASLFCVNVAFADTQTVYSWESPEGTPVETGGTMVYTNGDGERLNYPNADYHTICLNGKLGNIGDAEASTNAGHMVLTLDEALQTGDVITITAYRNKNADGKNASIYFLFENGAEWKDTNSFVNICADDADEDYDDDGATPNTVTWTITDAEAGSKTIKLTRNSASTNLFITKMTITREVEDAPVGGGDGEADTEKAYATFENPSNTNAVWNAETNSFTWAATSWNQIRNIGLPTGDITKYAKLVIDCEIISGEKFRILFYKGDANKTLWVTNSGVTEFDIVAELKALGEDYMDYLTDCTEICLSGSNASATGEVKINSMYLETAPATTPVEPAGEVVVAANFDDGNSPFFAWHSNTRTVVDGVLEIAIPAAASAGDQQMAYDNTFVYQGTYTMKFKVKGSAAGSINAHFQVTTDGYKDAGNFGAIEFGTEWTEFESTVTVGLKAADRLIFNLGSFEGTVYMDDFELSVVLPEETEPVNWVSVITNGDFEGTSAYYFVAKENGGANAGAFLAPAIADGIGKDGSRGITMKSYAGAVEEWDAQFWIVAAKGLPAGTEFRVSFDYRASAAVQIATQAHGEPGGYQHWDAIGSPSFTTEWQHYEKSGIVSAEMAGENGFKSIAFNLSKDKENDVEFFFDNIVFEAVGVAPAYDMASMEKAVADANAWKATLSAEDEIEAMAIEAIDEYIKSAQDWAAEAEAQEDVEMAAEDLVMTIEALKGQLDVQKLMAKVEEARIAGEEALNAYPENLRSDRAGLVNALRGLPRFAMGMTAEMIQEAIDAVYTAIPLYKAENEPITAGTFYMKNVAAGKYLVGGNSWGTQASLGAHGLDVIVTRLENGKYSIDTNVPNGAKHYLGSNGYVDSDLAEWTLTKVTGGNYVISIDDTNFIGYDGSTSVVSLTLTDTTTAAAQWQFITKDELIREFANATADSPVDATFFIQGQNFSREDNNRNGAWQGGPDFGGANENFCAEKWNNNFDIYQDLTGLVNGTYRLTVQGFYRAGNGGTTETAQHAMLYAGSKSTPLVNILSEAGNEAFAGGNVSSVEGYGDVPNNMATASAGFSAGLYAGNSVTVLVTDGTLRIGVKKETLIENDWTIFDNFELAYLGTELYDAVTPLIELVGEAKAWKAELNAEDEMQAQIIATIDQMIPAAQAVIDNPEPLAAVEEMYNSVYMFLFQTKISLAQYEAQMAQALMATYTEPTDAAGFEAAINQVFIVSNDLMMNAGNGEYDMDDLAVAVAAMKVAQEAFIVENTPVYKTASVALAANMFKNWDGAGADAQPVANATPEMGVGANLGAGAMVYGFSTVDYLHYADLTGYDKIVFEGTPGVQLRVLMNRVEHEGALTEVNPTIGEDGKAEVDLTGYEFAHLNAIKTGWGSPEGTITAINLVYTPSIAYLCGATETTEAIYTALVNADYKVTALNYDDVTLTEEIIASDFVGKYHAVVLAGNTGSGTNLAKAFNLLVGKVNVLSTKAFWYAKTSPAGTNGGNPGTADAPSLSLVKTVAAHPIFAGIEGDEFAVFNDMAKENGRYLQSNGQFADNTPAQKALATTNGADCIGEAWVDGKGWIIIPVDGIQPEGYLTAAGEALYVNALDYILAGVEYVEPVIDVTSITLDQTAVELLEGATVTLVATVAPENAADKTITWTSSNEAVATVADGVVTAVAAGEATITAQAGNVTATCTITIKADGIEVIGIESTLNGDIYDLSGRLVKKNATSIDGLQKGIYLINGKKFVVK